MYNSLIIAVLSRLFSQINRYYQNSFIKKGFTFLNKYFVRFYGSSNFKYINKNIKNIFMDSFAQKLVNKVIHIMDLLLNGLFNVRKNVVKGSVVSESLEYYSSDITRGLRLVYEVMLGLGLVVSLLILVGFAYLPLSFSLFMVIFGLIGRMLNGQEITILRSSIAFNFIYDLFELDKGGESWW